MKYSKYGEWQKNSNGNYVLIDSGECRATIFPDNDSLIGWRARLSDCLLTESSHSIEYMQELVEQTLRWPRRDWECCRPRGSAWKTNKTGGLYKQTKAGNITIKRSKSGSWYAASHEGLLPCRESPRWFVTQDEAKCYVDEVYK